MNPITEPVKITSLELENVKRIRACAITPTQNGLTVIGGRNNQGKTSVLDAIAWALGGDRHRPSRAAREGSSIPPRLCVKLGDNGAVIPTSIANKIIGMVKEISPLYQRATHYNVGGNLTIPSYDESTQKITMAYATEFTALTSTSGKFTSISLSGFLAGALTKVSISLVNNSKFDIVSYVIRKMAEAVAEWIENELINGTASKIEGIR